MPRFRPRPDRRYLAFYKPYAVLSQFTRADASGKQTLAAFAFPEAVYPVGRLDYDTEGLIILTDDRALNGALLNPRAGHERTYLVQVERLPAAEALDRLSRGLLLGSSTTRKARARLLTTEPDLPERAVPVRFRKTVPTAWIELTLTEGKNRQVRRMTAQVGHPTLRLVRKAIGALTLAGLGIEPGQWRLLSAPEVQKLFVRQGLP